MSDVDDEICKELFGKPYLGRRPICIHPSRVLLCYLSSVARLV